MYGMGGSGQNQQMWEMIEHMQANSMLLQQIQMQLDMAIARGRAVFQWVSALRDQSRDKPQETQVTQPAVEKIDEGALAIQQTESGQLFWKSEEDKKEVDMDAILGGGDDDEEAEDEGPGEFYENLDIPDDIEPVEMPEKPDEEITKDADGVTMDISMNMHREREWLKLGFLHGYVDHKGKYHAPQPETYQKMVAADDEEKNKMRKVIYDNLDLAISRIKEGTYKNDLFVEP